MKRFLITPYLLIFTSITFCQGRYQVIIDEIMADPSPSVSLPAQEWIEIKNISPNPINLSGWRIGDANSISGPFPSYILAADSCLIVSSSSGASNLNPFGRSIGIASFPSLDNEGDQVYIQNKDGQVIHGVYYSDKYYKNELKRQGGWSLEMIDTRLFCAGMDNWTSSQDRTGGSPGKPNSVSSYTTLDKSPDLISSFTLSADSIVLVFDQPIDSSFASKIQNFKIDHGLSIVSSATIPLFFEKVLVVTSQALKKDSVYSIELKGIIDCYGNEVESTFTIKTGIAVEPSKADLVINEILFNPKPNGVDYLEIYNASDKIFDASRISLANRNAAGVISSIRSLSGQRWMILPGDYLAVCEEPKLVELNYLVKNPRTLLSISSMPSMPDDEGTIILLNGNGEVVDELQYNEEWHFKLLQSNEGVALERLNPKAPTQQPANWHSASSTSGYGTPGYRNSQYHSMDDINKAIIISPTVFSPDNDGVDDLLKIQYRLNINGYSGAILIFDHEGRKVKTLVRNDLFGISGYYTWDGLNDFGSLAGNGIYIILIELFNLEGKKLQFKKQFVLASKKS